MSTQAVPPPATSGYKGNGMLLLALASVIITVPKSSPQELAAAKAANK